jgi:methionyl-tRNA formyltransferase
VRLAVAATAPLGAAVLEGLAARHHVELLLTRPDRPRGRGRRLAAPPAKEAAERLGIRVEQPERLEEFSGTAPAVVVAAYGALIPEHLLGDRLWLNVHPSLLPRWRGAAPVERALMAGDELTGVTIHRTTAELDAGPVAAQRSFPIEPEDDAGTVYDRAARVALELLDEVLPEPRFLPQAVDGVTYAEKIGPDDRRLDWSQPAAELVNRVRAPDGLAAHRRVGDGRRATADRLARAARGVGVPAGGRRRRAARGPAGGRPTHDRRRVPARPSVTVSAPVRREVGPDRHPPARSADVRWKQGGEGPKAPGGMHSRARGSDG